MIYKFRSKAAGDVIMLGPNGDHVMRLLGREPAPKGIFEVADLDGIIARLHEAVQADEPAATDGASADGADVTGKPPVVSLHQRVWPLVQLLERSRAADEPVVWGV